MVGCTHPPCPVHAGIHSPLGRHPLADTPGQTPTRQNPPTPTATAADGTHSTGMHSCFLFLFQKADEGPKVKPTDPRWLLLSSDADKRFAFANSRLDLELSRTLEHLNIEHKEQIILIDSDKRQFQRKLDKLNAKKRQIQMEKRQTLDRSHSTSSLVFRSETKSFEAKHSSGPPCKSRTRLSIAFPSRWTSRAMSAPALFPTGSDVTSDLKSSQYKVVSSGVDPDRITAPAKYIHQKRPMTHPVGRFRKHDSRKVSKEHKIDIHAPKHTGAKRRISVPTAKDLQKWEIHTSGLYVESD